MRLDRLPGRLLLCSILLSASACAEPPTKEMNQAQGALDAARAAGAADFAPDEFRAAQEALARSHQAVAERDYRQALNFALDARDRAQTAARQAGDEKARARTEADRALRTAEANLQRVRERAAAVQGRLPVKASAPIREAMQAAEASLKDARSAFDNSDYRQTVSLLTTLEARLTETTSQIDAAVATRSPRRPSRRNP
jgi:hypothetical protein